MLNEEELLLYYLTKLLALNSNPQFLTYRVGQCSTFKNMVDLKRLLTDVDVLTPLVEKCGNIHYTINGVTHELNPLFRLGLYLFSDNEIDVNRNTVKKLTEAYHTFYVAYLYLLAYKFQSECNLSYMGVEFNSDRKLKMRGRIYYENWILYEGNLFIGTPLVEQEYI